MKAKTRLKLILALAAAMAAALISGCSIGQPDYEETLDMYNITSQVTYYGNGGTFGSEILYRLMGFTEGSTFYDIQAEGSEVVTTHTISAGSNEYIFDGWCYISTVEIDGEAYYVCEDDTVASDFTLTEDGVERMVVVKYGSQLVISRTDYEYILRTAKQPSELPTLQLGDKVDTTMVLPEGHIYVAASWVTAQKIDYVLVLWEGATSLTYTTVNDDGDTVECEYQAGDIIYQRYFGSNTSLTLTSREPVNYSNKNNTLVNMTWLETFYQDADCTQAYTSGATVTKPDDGSDVMVYVPYIEGDWEVVKTASDVRYFFTRTSNNYYVMNDIDCSGWSSQASALTSSALTKATFSGTIYGNGHTISGLWLTADSLGNASYTAVFGSLTASAVLKDITFDGLTVVYTTSAPMSGSYTMNTYLLFSDVADGATISNVTVKNATLDLTVRAGVTVMNISSGTDTDNWLYAEDHSDTSETDAAFAAKYDITVESAELMVLMYYGEDGVGAAYYQYVAADQDGYITDSYYLYWYEKYYTDIKTGMVYDKRIKIDDGGNVVRTYYTYRINGVLCETDTDPSAAS